MRNKLVYALFPITLAAVTSATVIAEESKRELEEVIVTAEKREAAVQDTPIAISAFNDQMMDDLGILGASEVANFTPGMSYNSGDNSNRASIRGVGRTTNELGSDPGVAVYVDGVYTSETAPIGSPPVNVDRIEVLRGPQGTLYGRNALGGAVNIISKRPSSDFEGEFRITAGNYDLLSYTGVISGPITDRLRYRILATQDTEGGLVESENSADIGDTDRYYVEAQVEFDITDNMNLWVKYSHAGWDENSGPAWPGLYIDEYSQSSPAYGSLNLNPWVGWDKPNPTAKDIYKVDYDYAGYLKLDDNHQWTVQLAWDLGDMQFKYTGGYSEYDWSNRVDWDASSNPDRQYFVYIGEDKEWQSHEMQLVSSSGDAFQWMIGAYYYKEQIFQPFVQLDPYNVRMLNPLNSVNYAPESNPEGIVYNQEGKLDSEAIAFFTQLDYDVSDKLHVSFGLRYSDDEKTGSEHQDYTYDGILIGLPFALKYDLGWVEQNDSWDAITGKIAADYAIDEDKMVYGWIGTGYKSGGYKLGNLISVASGGELPEDIVDEEHVTAYEIGYKTTINNVLRLNVAAYYYDYQDLQVPTAIITASGIQHTIFLNADEAENIGAEAEVTWLATDNLTLLGIYSYQNTEITKMNTFVKDETAPPTEPQNGLEGKELIMAPHNKLTLNATYRWETDMGAWSLGATYTHTDKQFYSIFNDKDTTAPAWDRWDLRASWENPERNMRLIGYMKNAGDEEILHGVARVDFAHDNARLAVPGRPRTYGVEFHYIF